MVFKANFILKSMSWMLHMVSRVLATVISGIGWLAGRLYVWFMDGFARGYHV
jgi:hypothetical protein